MLCTVGHFGMLLNEKFVFHFSLQAAYAIVSRL